MPVLSVLVTTSVVMLHYQYLGNDTQHTSKP